MKKVFIIGAGIMGRGIAQVSAETGYDVYITQEPLETLESNLELIRKGLQKLAEKGKITDERAQEIMDRIHAVPDLAKAKEADIVIEAVTEDVQLKQKIFRELDQITGQSVILASNTTSCSITEIASATQNPGRVIGMHFFNPATLMRLVEIMPGLLTEPSVVESTREIALSLGKDPVMTAKEGPAGVTSRILAGLLNEAVWVLSEGIADVEAIDKAVMLGCNHRMGPLALIDMIGIDTHYAKTRMLFEKTGDLRYRPCILLEQMIKAGLLGKKSGKGFYNYSVEPPVQMNFFKK